MSGSGDDFYDLLAFGIAVEGPRLLVIKRAADEDDHPFTIAVDLDGTLAEVQEPFDPDTIGGPRAAAIDWVRQWKEAGARIIIFTVRGDAEQVAAWLDEHDVPYDHINENPDQPEGSSGKVLADAYYDDRAFNAEDPGEHGPTLLAKAIAHGEETAEHDPERDHKTVIEIVRQTVTMISAPGLLADLRGSQSQEAT